MESKTGTVITRGRREREEREREREREREGGVEERNEKVKN